MKIHVGKNKKEAKEVTLKNLISKSVNIDGDGYVKLGRFDDDSASWVEIRQMDKKGSIDTVIGFNPENDNIIVDLYVWRSFFKLDEENMKKVNDL